MKIEDLLRDPSFRNWANGAPPEDVVKWDAYLDRHPEHAKLLLTAREMVKAQPFAADMPDAAEAGRAWVRLESSIRGRKIRRKRRNALQYMVAASVLVLVSLGTYMLWPGAGDIHWTTVQTAPGEIRTIALGDGSTVTLNGNSILEHPIPFADEARTVRLHGEAYFDIAHRGTAAPFTVHSGAAQITVLGTEFNVKARNERPVVSLVEGKVQISSTEGGHSATLQPGQSAEIGKRSIQIRSDDVDARSSWRNHLWVFDETPLQEILASLHESFGVTAEVDPAINLDKTISGKLSTKDLTTLYTALEAMLLVEITDRDTGIVIQNR